MTEQGPADGADDGVQDTAADRRRTLSTVHRLVADLSAQLPDPLVAQVRDWLGREDLVGIAEVLVTSAITLGVSVTPKQAETLAALPAAPGRRPGLPPELRVSPDATAPALPSFEPGPPVDDTDRAVVAAVFRSPKTAAIRRSSRSADGDETHRVYLIEAGTDAELWQLTAEAQRALQARGVQAPRVEAYWSDEAPTGYQQAALGASLPLWTRPDLPTRGPSLFGAAIDRQRAARVSEWFQWEGEVWGTMTRLHRLLLRLAPDLSVEPLAALRRALAEGELAKFAVELCATLAESGLALSPSEVALLREIPRQIEEPELDLSALDRIPVGDAPEPVTGFDLGPAPDDGLDAAPTVVMMMAAQPGVAQVWRAWRGSGIAAVPVFLIEVEPGLAAWDVAFDAHLAQAPAGPAHVEVFWTGEPLPDFHLEALQVADPLWIATLEESPHTGGIRTTGVYDFADADGVPRFTDDHVRLPDPAECDRLAARMIAGDVVVRSDTAAEDVIDPGRGRVVPQDHRTDGEWIWRASAAYYLAEYQLAPHPDLLGHLRRMERGAENADA